MRAALAIAVSGLLFTPFNSATAAQNRVSAEGADDAGWTVLFPEDGEPRGWTVTTWNDLRQPAEAGVVWSVKDGVLHGSAIRGTQLVSEREYAISNCSSRTSTSTVAISSGLGNQATRFSMPFTIAGREVARQIRYMSGHVLHPPRLAAILALRNQRCLFGVVGMDRFESESSQHVMVCVGCHSTLLSSN